jgi:hypothetical protein
VLENCILNGNGPSGNVTQDGKVNIEYRTRNVEGRSWDGGIEVVSRYGIAYSLNFIIPHSICDIQINRLD